MTEMTAQSTMSSGAGPRPWRVANHAGVFLFAGVLFAFLGAAFFPPTAFSIDEAIYVDMADAMATRGAFDVTPQDWPEDAPLMAKSDGLVKIIGDRAVPQYPGLYGVIAAPFFFVAGVKGLIFLNALCGVLCLWLTHRLARILTNDPWTARASVLLLGGASIFFGYVFAIWPHMLALCFVLGGAHAILCAGNAEKKNARAFAGAAGLIFGLGVGVRVDVILAAVAACFWLRLFAKPAERSLALSLLLGLAPGLFVVAAVNEIKFGAFNPFSYGADAGGVSIAHHAKIILPVAFLAAFAFLIDVSSKPVAGMIAAARRSNVIVVAGGVAAALGALWMIMPGLFSGAWLMLVDIQSYAGPPRPGLEKDAYGYWDFWGVPKKALLQSMPWAPLALAPLFLFFRGHNTKESAFLLLFAAAFVLFFAMRGWHGGMAYNMRYYLPAAPFLAILAAMSLSVLRPAFAKHKNLFLRSAAAGILIAIGTYAFAPLYGAYATPFQLYPQILLAGLLSIAILAALVATTNMRAQTVAALAGAAIANAAMISLFDAYGYYADRARYAPYDRAYAEMVRSDAVVFTAFDELLVGASINDAAVIRVKENNIDMAQALIDAYQQQDRCVYAHTHRAAHLLNESDFDVMAMPLDAPAPGLALYVYRDAPARCR